MPRVVLKTSPGVNDAGRFRLVKVCFLRTWLDSPHRSSRSFLHLLRWGSNSPADEGCFQQLLPCTTGQPEAKLFLPTAHPIFTQRFDKVAALFSVFVLPYTQQSLVLLILVDESVEVAREVRECSGMIQSCLSFQLLAQILHSLPVSRHNRLQEIFVETPDDPRPPGFVPFCENVGEAFEHDCI